MNKRALFLSVAITTFILVIVGGVFSVYQAFAKSGEPVAQVQPVNQVVSPVTVSEAAAPAVQQVTPEQAAAIAAEYLGRQDVYAVESDKLDSVTVYKVTFSSGDIVYVGLDGQILRVDKLPYYSSDHSSQSSILPISTGHSEDQHEIDEHGVEVDD
ncbi:MAG: hypothetical protein WBV22_06880 [Anaerolineaceae bacterium]